MEYFRPTTLDEAYGALVAEDARCIAGGQSLVAMMNLGVAAPGRIVSLRRIESLRGIETLADGSLRIGAMATHAEIAALDAAGAGPALLAQTAALVAYPAIRAQGTIGGSVAHADPAADYPVALVAADATIEIGSAAGPRVVAARDFFKGAFETALEAGEIVTAIRVPRGPEGARTRYEKLSLVAGDFAILSVAAIVADRVTVGVGGLDMKPLFLTGIDPTETALIDAGHRLVAAGNPPTDHRASSEYRRQVLPRLLSRAVLSAGGVQ
jgi:carbon-monoxide dehydrogenase medium subunit